jgi:nucleoside-diphosphate-sugar epimerase
MRTDLSSTAMLVAIAGGHGKVALRLARLLRERGDEVRSLIRSGDQADDVRGAGAEPVECDLESANEAQVAMALGSADAVVFAAGAGPGSGPERKWTVDYGGAVKLIAAAHADEIRRYVMVSSMGADPAAEGDDAASVYFRTKGQADEELQTSGLDYTIVRPGGLTNDPGTGRVRIGEHVGRGRISRDDVAAVLAGSLHEPATVRKLFEVVSGDVPVEEALRSLGAR